MQPYNGKVTVENRKYPRIYFNITTKYAPLQKGKLPKAISSLVDDLGGGGMAMITTAALPKGQLLAMNLYLPPIEKYLNTKEPPRFCDDECQPVTLLARVAWSRPEGPLRYRTGIQFVDIDKKNAKVLKHFLVEYELDEPLISPESPVQSFHVKEAG